MSLPIVCSALTCPSCSSTQVQLEEHPDRIDGVCAYGHRFPHPDQPFARDLVRGRERIDLDRSGT
jgi:hypothetical protein